MQGKTIDPFTSPEPKQDKTKEFHSGDSFVSKSQNAKTLDTNIESQNQYPSRVSQLKILGKRGGPTEAEIASNIQGVLN